MRDQDLVYRAERAANALEEAWIRWRGRHALGTGPMAPVSSYVGYSIGEPWGQPRVIFGIEAAEAERLAAILDCYDFGGPVAAEVSAQPDRQRADSVPLPWTVPAGNNGVPAQAAPVWEAPVWEAPDQAAEPDFEPAQRAYAGGTKPRNSAPQSGQPARTAPAGRPAQPSAAAGHPVPPAPAEPDGELVPLPEPDGELALPGPDGEVAPLSGPDGELAPLPEPDGELALPGPDGEDAPLPEPDGELAPIPAPDSPAPPADLAGAGTEDLTAEESIVQQALSQAAAVVDLPAELPDNEAAYLQELAARTVSRPGIVALKPLPAGLPEPAWSPVSESAKAPRQTVPDRGQPADVGSPDRDMAPAVPSDDSPAGDGVPVAKLRPVSRFNRSRPPAGTAEWTAGDEQKRAPTDTAV